MDGFVVVCLDEDGFATLATRRVFEDPGAASDYARGIAKPRRAYVIRGDWRNLRFADVTTGSEGGVR